MLLTLRKGAGSPAEKHGHHAPRYRFHMVFNDRVLDLHSQGRIWET